MKHLLILHTQPSAVLAASYFMQSHKRCDAEFYHRLSDAPLYGKDIHARLQLAGNETFPPVLPYSANAIPPPDYVLCLHNSCLAVARSYPSPSLVFDYHFPLETDTSIDQQNEILKDMKLYLVRFCKMYLNEFM